jgi:hypothetical protein
MVEETFQVQLPASLLRYGLDQNEIQRRVIEWLALSLFTDVLANLDLCSTIGLSKR